MRSTTYGALAASILLATAEPVSAQQLTAEQWREDLYHMAQVIAEVHPDPYLFHDEEEFAAAVDGLSSSLGDLGDDAIILGFARIAAMLRDGHSGLFPASAAFPLRQSAPLRLLASPDGWIVVAVHRSQQWALGARVDEIGGRAADEVMMELARYSGADNEAQQRSNAPIGLAMGRIAAGLDLLDENGMLHLEVEADGIARSLFLRLDEASRSLGWIADPFGAPGDSIASIDEQWDQPPLAFSRPGTPYWAQYVTDAELLYVQINQVNDSDAPARVDGSERVLTITDFLRASLEMSRENPITRLVIDLRNNPGGNNFRARAMLRELQAFPELTEEGHLFVLTGPRTFSAAMNFVSLLEAYTDALFVGEPPGARPNHFGDAGVFPLPHSGLVLRVSTLNWQLGVQPWDIRSLMQPDIWAPWDIASLKSGTDPALEAVFMFEETGLLADRMVTAYDEGGLEGAMWLFNAEAEPERPGMWHFRSDVLTDVAFRLYEAGGGEDEATAILFGAAETYGDRPAVLFGIGRTSSRIPNWEAAAHFFGMARELWPQNDVIASHLAHAKFELAGGGGPGGH